MRTVEPGKSVIGGLQLQVDQANTDGDEVDARLLYEAHARARLLPPLLRTVVATIPDVRYCSRRLYGHENCSLVWITDGLIELRGSRSGRHGVPCAIWTPR